MHQSTLERNPTHELSGEWEFTADPKDAGGREEWYDSDATWPDSRTVSIPHAWQEHDDLRGYAGAAWYRRTVTVTELDDGERALLYFGAADYEATVWVNGERVGINHDGYLPFRFDVTEHLTAGDNTVSVRVFDPEDVSEIPHGKQGEPWYTRVSGIWQRVDLAVVPATRVIGVRATPDLEHDATEIAIDVRTADTNPTALSTTVRVLDGGDEVTAETVDVTAGCPDRTFADGDVPEGVDGITVDATATTVVDLDDPTSGHPRHPTSTTSRWN